MRVDVSSDVETTFFTDSNVEHYYTTWQVLLAAELADAGVHIPINLADPKTFRRVRELLQENHVPDGAGYSFNLIPIYALRDFAKHERSLDAVVWFAEEQWRALCDTTKGKGGRFR